MREWISVEIVENIALAFNRLSCTKLVELGKKKEASSKVKLVAKVGNESETEEGNLLFKTSWKMEANRKTEERFIYLLKDAAS